MLPHPELFILATGNSSVISVRQNYFSSCMCSHKVKIKLASLLIGPKAINNKSKRHSLILKKNLETIVRQKSPNKKVIYNAHPN